MNFLLLCRQVMTDLCTERVTHCLRNCLRLCDSHSGRVVRSGDTRRSDAIEISAEITGE